MKALFICNQNQHRSKTAEEMFSDKFDTRSKGLYNNEVSGDDLLWADVVLVMEDWQRSELAKRFPSEYMKAKILNLDVPDVYQYNQPELKELLNERIATLEIA